MHTGKLIFSQIMDYLPHTHISTLCSKIQRQPQDQILQMSRPIPLHGIRPTDLQRKSQRYRSMSSSTTKETLSHGHSEQCISKHIIQRQQSTRLANLRRLCSIPHPYSPQVVRKRRFRRRTESDRLRTRFDNYRPLFIRVPVGKIPQYKGCHQTSYTYGFKGQHSILYSYKRWQIARCQYPRSINTGARLFLYYGQRIHGLRKTLHAQSVCSLFRYKSQIQLAVSSALFSSHQKNYRSQMRSDYSANRFLQSQKLSRKTSTHQILRSGNRQDTHFSNQQLYPIPINYHRTISISLADRTLLQMDKTTLTNQVFLWNHRKRRQDSNMDCSVRLCSHCYYQEAASPGGQSLHNFANFECYGI